MNSKNRTPLVLGLMTLILCGISAHTVLAQDNTLFLSRTTGVDYTLNQHSEVLSLHSAYSLDKISTPLLGDMLYQVDDTPADHTNMRTHNNLINDTSLYSQPARNSNGNESAKPTERFDIYGDARFRFEANSAFENQEARHREVLRARIGAEYKLNDYFSSGARLVTGSLDDPNASDETIGDFNDNFEASFDLVYLAFNYKKLRLDVGKFHNPFVWTDLVWDGDVNPQGASGNLDLPSFLGIKPRINGLFFFVDEQPNGPNSLMGGGQVVLQPKLGANWNLEIAGAYYDYTIKSLANATPGDTRSNRLTGNGEAFLSDFNLVDLILRSSYTGWSKEWPLGLTIDYVKNTGSVDQNDEGISLDFIVGERAQKGDLQFRYGYASAEIDAVFTAFSHNNLTLATNYRRHAISADYIAIKNTRFNLTWYLYRPIEARLNATNTDYRSRFRANVVISF